MPKSSITFISGFLIPSLNEGKFGDNLKWIDRENTIFQIEWRHKGGPTWTEREAQVFAQEWDKKKGHYKPSDGTYYPKSKQRFRSLLYKLTKQGCLSKLKSDEKFKKVYRIVHEKKIRRKVSTSCDSYESELSNEGDDRSEVVDDLNEEYRRKVSEDNVTNILQDHPYSCIARSDNEKKHEINYLYVEMKTPSLSDSLKFLEGKLLSVKNYPYDDLHYKPSLITDEDYTQNISEGLVFDDGRISTAPLLHMPGYSSINSFSIPSPYSSRQMGDYVQNSSTELGSTINGSRFDDISEKIYCSSFRDMDVPLQELLEMN